MTDEKVIRRLCSGDEKAIAILMDKYSRLLWKCAAAILYPSEEDIEECVADVFISLWQKPEIYDESRGKLSAFLCTMVKNKALDRLRLLRARKEECVDQIPETVVAENSSEYDLDQCLEQLSEEDREIIKRRYYHEQKPTEIARDMGLDKKRVENRLFRSKKKLKGMLRNTSACPRTE